MVTIVLPIWFVWFITTLVVLNIILSLLELWLKYKIGKVTRELNKRKGE